MGKEKMKNEIARIENSFIENARYSLSVREQKVLLYLIANTDPTRNNFIEHIVPVSELEAILKADNKKWGGIYEEINKFCDTATDRKISFPTNFIANGKPLKGYINWFQSIRPVEDEKGNVSIRFLFASDLKPFLLQLNQYAKINRLEVAQMKSSYSIRLYQIFKALREKHRKHKYVVTKTYELDELKEILGLYDKKTKKYKYSTFKDFNRYVLKPAEREIREQTSICIEIYTEKGKYNKVTHLRFNVYDNTAEMLLISDKKNRKQLFKTIINGGDYTKTKVSLFKKAFPDKYNEIVKYTNTSINSLQKVLPNPIPNLEQTKKDNISSLCLEYALTELEKEEYKENRETT